jgi:hypothetical protein
LEFRSGIYQLHRIMDDPRYEGFAAKNGFLAPGLPLKRTSLQWKMRRLAPTWVPLEVIGRVRNFNDFPCVNLLPAFSQKAVDVLGEFLEPNGELLPLKTTLGSYYAYNVTTGVDALDLRHSAVSWLNEPFTAFEVEHYELIAAAIERRDVFFIPQTAADVYVSDRFVRKAAEFALRGFDFQKVWPFPPGVDWRRVAKEQAGRQKEEGLPAGRTVKGNTVVIRLPLSRPTSKPTKAETRLVNKLMDSLDAMLVDHQVAASLIGNLEGVDYGAPGECRLFLSCPDADTLAKKLRPWLRAVEWPGGCKILKRYGNFADRGAPEQEANVEGT